MLKRSFYKFDEAVERLGTDSETFRQTIGQGMVSVFFRFDGAVATWTGEESEHPEERASMPMLKDPHCRWYRTPVEVREGVVENRYTLVGWFRLAGSQAKSAALGFDWFPYSDVLVMPSVVASDSGPWDIWFELAREDSKKLGMHQAWFLATEVEEIIGNRDFAVAGRHRWSWGDYTNDLLEILRETAHLYWSDFDPKNPDERAGQKEVVDWPMKERGLTENAASAIDLILRPKNLPKGRRKVPS